MAVIRHDGAVDMRTAGIAIWLALLAYLVPQYAVHAQSGPSGTSCNAAVVYDASTNGSTRLVVARQTGPIYVCGYVFNSTAAVRVKLIHGTGTTCATGSTDLSPAYQLSPVVADTSPYFRGMFVPPGKDLCINTSAGQPVQATVYFSQLP